MKPNSLLLTLSTVVMGAFAAPTSTSPNPGLDGFIVPLRNSGSLSTARKSDITYTLGNPVLTDDVNLYHIYYGNWTESQKAILEHFNNNIGDSKWYNINRKYYYQKDESSEKVYVKGKVVVKQSVDDAYSKGTSLSGNAIPEIIQDHIDAGRLPEDPKGIYFLLSSGDVSESIRSDLGEASFCNDYCGYHVSWELKSGTRIYYSFSGNPSACMYGCSYSQNSRNSPNKDPAVDAMISIVAHELVEAVSDPFSDGDRAWQDGYYYENADKCAWTYGTTSRGDTGYTYNMELDGHRYLVQRNWDPVKQSCAQEA